WVLSYGTAKTVAAGGTGLGFKYSEFLVLQLIAVLFFAAGVPITGWLADRYGRRLTLLVATGAIMVFGLTFSVTLDPDKMTDARMLAFLIVGMLLMGFTFGPMSAVLPELFPTNVRYTGSGIAYNTASILGAAVAPFIATWLATTHGVGWVGIYLLVAGSLTFVALLVMRETKDTSLDAPGLDPRGAEL
ncbi:MFS transporter, partial [Rhodococcus sp. NPDC058514]